MVEIYVIEGRNKIHFVLLLEIILDIIQGN